MKHLYKTTTDLKYLETFGDLVFSKDGMNVYFPGNKNLVGKKAVLTIKLLGEK